MHTMTIFSADFGAASAGLVRTLFELCVAIVMLRFLLPLARVNYFNPICQFIIRLTDPILRPLRRVIPSVGRIDGAALIFMLILQIAQVALVAALAQVSVPLPRLLAYAGITLIQLCLYIFLISIVASAILSWFAQSINHPILPFLEQLTHPILAPIRRLIPAISGIDISPLLAILAIQFLITLLG